MALRYRNSINLGGGFRVNISKSGVGYSWGFKGYRVTHKAGGGKRTTYSLPGTGLSWTEDSSKKKAIKKASTPQTVNQNEGVVLYQAENADMKQISTENTQDFLKAIKKYSGIRTALIWTCVASALLSFGKSYFLILLAAGIAGLIYLSAAKKITVEYDYDDYGKHRIEMMDQAMSLLSNNKGLWQVNKLQSFNSQKTHAGAGVGVLKKAVKFKKKKPYFLKTDATCYYIKLLQDQIFVLPDRLIIKGKKGWGAIDYSDLDIEVKDIYYVEDEKVPEDAQIIGYTWMFVNKNGTPDMRYNNNRQMPKCNYGSVEFTSSTGFDAILYLSNIENAKQFETTVKTMMEEAKQAKLLPDSDAVNTEADDENASYDELENDF